WDVRAADKLDSTEVAQPAILAASVAAARALEASGMLPDLVAGHSVGELAALVVARALPFEDALRVVVARANAMGAHPGSMAAVLGLTPDVVETVCAGIDGTVVVANVNAPGQVVISGEQPSVHAAIPVLKKAGARKVIPLAVSVAAHSPLMEPAKVALARALRDVQLNAPSIPFASCTEGRFLTEPSEIKDALIQALTRRVDWPACVTTVHKAGTDLFVEVGPGRVLTGLNKRIVPDARATSVGSHAEAIALANELAAAR
ncbi:MAG TPA: ACP S-malonyltransferase, partial [Actinomycetota bacterium]|nr:ACP S-malonyltransferase [Actinomycetota bacterium]